MYVCKSDFKLFLPILNQFREALPSPACCFHVAWCPSKQGNQQSSLISTKFIHSVFCVSSKFCQTREISEIFISQKHKQQHLSGSLFFSNTFLHLPQSFCLPSPSYYQFPIEKKKVQSGLQSPTLLFFLHSSFLFPPFYAISQSFLSLRGVKQKQVIFFNANQFKFLLTILPITVTIKPT